MYHELTYEKQRANRRRRIVRFAFVIVLLVAFAFMAIGAQARAKEQAALSVRESVLNAAKQCCAVEGSYPATLEHLEKNYGLVINRGDYVVSYEWFADNVLPSVVVSAR